MLFSIIFQRSGPRDSDLRGSSQERDQRGATLVEYVLLISLMILVSMGALQFFSTTASERFSEISSSVGEALNQ